MYKAMWHGTAVAAKILKNTSAIALGDFRSEIEVLRKVHHPNAVQFLGARPGPLGNAPHALCCSCRRGWVKWTGRDLVLGPRRNWCKGEMWVVHGPWYLETVNMLAPLQQVTGVCDSCVKFVNFHHW